MIREFLKDSLLYALSSLFTRGLAFLLLPLYTWVLAPDDFGVLDYLTVVGSLLAVTVTLDIGQGVARFVPEVREDVATRRRYASTSLWFTIVMYGLVAGAIAWCRAPISQRLFATEAHADVLLAAAGAYLAGALAYLVQAQLRWELRAPASSLVSLITGTVTALTTALFILGLRMGVAGAFWAQCAGGAVGAVTGLYLARSSYRPEFSWAKLREMLSFSAPLVPSSLGVMVALYIDRIAIQRLMTLADVGVYGVGNRVALIVSLITLGFQGTLTPLIYAHHRDPDTPGQLAKLFRAFVAGGLALFAGLALFSDWIIALIAPPEYYEATTVVPLLALAALCTNMYIFAPGLELAKRTGTIAMINIAAAGFNTILNFALIPLMGITGAATATLLAAVGAFSWRMTRSQALYRVPHDWKALLVACFLVIAVVAGASLPDMPGWWKLFVDCVALGVVGVIIAGLHRGFRLGRKRGANL